MPAYDALLEIVDYHFYLGCWKLFFGNTVYRLLFSLDHPFFFPSITLVLLVFSFFHQKQLFLRIVPYPRSYHLFCFHHHGVGYFLSLHLQQLKMEQQRRRKRNVWGSSWSEMWHFPAAQKERM
jgi:hypothetical protein